MKNGMRFLVLVGSDDAEPNPLGIAESFSASLSFFTHEVACFRALFPMYLRTGIGMEAASLMSHA